MRREHWWPAGLAAALLLTVAGNVVLVLAAERGGGAAVEPDYYRRAVTWDSTLAEARASAALGWRLDASLSAPDAEGHGVLAVTVRDAAGAPLGGVVVRAEGFALARSTATRRAFTFADGPAGGYAARLPLARVEWYEFRVTADRGPAHFAARLRCLPGAACRPA